MRQKDIAAKLENVQANLLAPPNGFIVPVKSRVDSRSRLPPAIIGDGSPPS
jgi:hypothetical protein